MAGLLGDEYDQDPLAYLSQVPGLLGNQRPAGLLDTTPGMMIAPVPIARPRVHDDRERAFMKYLSQRTFKNEADARDTLRYYADKWAKPDAFQPTPNPFTDDFVSSIPLVKHGNGLRIGAAGKGSVAAKQFISSPGPIGNAPKAAWGGSDLQDYRKTAKAGETVHQEYVHLDSIPAAKLAGGKTGYGWDELQGFNPKRDSIPPVTLRQNKNGSTSIVDGNHRIEWFREQGFDSIPAYVIRPK